MKDYRTTDIVNKMIKALNAMAQELADLEHESFMAYLDYLRRESDLEMQAYLDSLEWLERISRENAGIIRARDEAMKDSLKMRR